MTPGEPIDAAGRLVTEPPAAPRAGPRERVDPVPPPRQPNRKVLIGAVAAGLIVLVGLGAFFVVRGGGDDDPLAVDDVSDTTNPPSTRPNLPREETAPSRFTTTTRPWATSTTTTSIGTPVELTPAGVTASATDVNGTDDCQPPNNTSFPASNLFDGDNATAWRVNGNGQGAVITVDFDGPTHLTKGGLVPGYAKRDPCSGVDRFPQSYRIATVTYLFDDGSSVTQRFTDAPTMQSIPLDVTTSRVTVTIAGVEEPLFPVGSDQRREKTAISEMQFFGVPQ